MKSLQTYSARVSSFVLLALFMPASAAAQQSAQYGASSFDSQGKLAQFFDGFTQFINDILVPLIFAISLLVFLYGVFRFFIAKQGDSFSREDAQNLMLWGILGFVLMVSIWGIVNIIAGGLGLTGDLSAPLPNAPQN